ncbi:dTDP-4-dehydrorhamnose reductase [Desulfogranum japonicum]|uniref:dTDP-4-dehydrorhamnose reductase n=1 Tax=Desulfogranum japonicum TaxID=231447 RepID=UPI00041DF69F|nr:dTDP-4-dehydrorhamnose reductase [Desulfogranum japonicum]
MNILITGANGQLGSDCKTLLAKDHSICCCDVGQVDITNAKQVADLFSKHRPDIVINCAAYTAVDACEDHEEICRAVNTLGPTYIAEQCSLHQTRFIQVSTDYVYDGKKQAPDAYLEDDATNPLSVYGKTKLEGDLAVARLSDHVILRTAWLYGINGKNFLKTMLRLATIDPKRTIRVVHDQYGSLTWSWRLAEQIGRLVESDIRGVVHASSEGYSTWYEAARYFLDAMDVPYSLEPCTTEEYPTPAKRPGNSILENSCLKKHNLNVMNDWREDVDEFVNRYRARLLEEASQ